MQALVFIIFFCGFTCFSHLALAHAVVMEYSLQLQPVKVNQASTVMLRFNSKIELGLSQVFLVSKGDKHQLLDIAPGSQHGQLLVNLPALMAGDYALRLKVFAADGHLTEDVIHFSVVDKTADLPRPARLQQQSR